MKLQQATKANESVATAGFETATTKSTEKPKDATELKLSAGGLLATGNARSVAGNATTKLRVRRDQNQLSAAIAANYARSASAADADTAVTVENYQGKSRYDGSWPETSRHSFRFRGCAIASKAWICAST